MRTSTTGTVGVYFISGQTIKGLTSRGPIIVLGVKESEHLVEGPVFKHDLDDVLNRTQLIRHRLPPVINVRVLC
jgi:hypothetical protein